MAIDEALMDCARRGIVTVRFYGWEPHCLSLGRNQQTRRDERAREDAAGLRPGRDIVRRPTGGRSVYHGPELTYSLTAPDRFGGGPRALYGRVNRAITRGLLELGAETDPPPGDPAKGLQPAPASPGQRRGKGTDSLGPDGCFRDPAPGEVIARGRKLVGSAQWRHAGAILQHGSILLENRQERGTLVGTDEEAGRAAIGLAELLPAPPERERLVAALGAAFALELGLPTSRAGTDEELMQRARRLEARYRSVAWTWRR